MAAATNTPRQNPKKYILGVDIGGTKIDAQLFEVAGNTISEKAVWQST